jgi:hypothetical protein
MENDVNANKRLIEQVYETDMALIAVRQDQFTVERDIAIHDLRIEEEIASSDLSNEQQRNRLRRKRQAEKPYLALLTNRHDIEQRIRTLQAQRNYYWSQVMDNRTLARLRAAMLESGEADDDAAI